MSDVVNSPQKCRYTVEGLSIAGKMWGDGYPTIALHGWLDNAASFDAVGEAQSGLQLLALDLPGHGMSDHKPPAGSYAIWDDLRIIVGVANALGWEKFAVVGHSRGAMIATLLAATLPNRVTSLSCIDGLLAGGNLDGKAISQLSRYVRDYTAEPGVARTFSGLDEAVAARRRSMPMQESSARRIVERGTVADENGRLRWRSDRRLTMASPLKLSGEDWRQVIAALVCPAQFLGAEQGMAERIVSVFPEIEQFFSCRRYPGDHHGHMDVGAECVAAALVEHILGASS